jgi:lauroyl/myristoyl acyltransferase
MRSSELNPGTLIGQLRSSSITYYDVLVVGKILLLTLIAWLLPPRFWRKAAMAISSILPTDGCLRAYRYFLSHKYPESEIVRISSRRRGYRLEMNLQILGLNRPWRSWRPEIHVNGTAHLRRALEGGHGAILWVTESAFSTLIVKMALHNNGYQACQLSRPSHGFSSRPFGVRFLNPFWTRIENRFIAERVLIGEEGGDEAMQVLRARLAANRIVIITVGWRAHKFAEVPFLNAQITLPTGPIRLASRTGAVLLPVFASTNVDGTFEVVIEEPLHPLRERTDVESIAGAYAKRLEPFVLNYPDQWTGWTWLARPIWPDIKCY